jgi:hypothetical protein
MNGSKAKHTGKERQSMKQQLNLTDSQLEEHTPTALAVFDTVTVRIGYKSRGAVGRLPRNRTLIARVVNRDADGEVLGSPLASGVDLRAVCDAARHALDGKVKTIILEFDPALKREADIFRSLPFGKAGVA